MRKHKFQRYETIWHVISCNNQLSLPRGAIVIGERYYGKGMTLYKQMGRYYFYINNKLELFTDSVERQLEVLVPINENNYEEL